MSPYVQELVILDPHAVRVLQGMIAGFVSGLHVGQLISFYAVVYLGSQQTGKDL